LSSDDAHQLARQLKHRADTIRTSATADTDAMNKSILYCQSAILFIIAANRTTSSTSRSAALFTGTSAFCTSILSGVVSASHTLAAVISRLKAFSALAAFNIKLDNTKTVKAALHKDLKSLVASTANDVKAVSVPVSKLADAILIIDELDSIITAREGWRTAALLDTMSSSSNGVGIPGIDCEVIERNTADAIIEYAKRTVRLVAQSFGVDVDESMT